MSIEAVSVIAGSLFLLSLLTLGQEFVKVEVPDASYFQTLGVLLLAACDWASQLESGLVFILSALILNYLLY